MSTASIVFAKEIEEYDWSALLGVSKDEVKGKMSEEDWDSFWDELTDAYVHFLDNFPTPEANTQMKMWWWSSSESDRLHEMLTSYGF